MSNRSLHAANFNVSVIGLSGDEATRGSIGVGKSCLCNRFVRPDEDSYYSDHIYMLSQSDYGGEVVNNVSWLYWGEATRVNPEIEQQNWIFRVIEQTEFIDDSAFTLLSHGSHDSYVKRCLSVKLKSARKLMYICKDQLGMEDEYRKEYLPDGKINIDGFLLIFDVSARGCYADRQWEFLREVLSAISKSKRRVVIATTKNDTRGDEMRNELDRFLARKEFRTAASNIPIVDTSAKKGINVDSAFLMLGSLIEKCRTKPRVIPYVEAERAHDETMERFSHSLRESLNHSVTNHRTNWQEWSRRQDRHLQGFFAILGTQKVKILFNEHVDGLKKAFLSERRKAWLQELPRALDDLIPNSQTFRSSSLKDMIHHIKGHERFDRWFIPTCIEWNSFELIDNGEARIPFNLLTDGDPDAASILEHHSLKLMNAETREERRKEFMSLLRRNKSVKAGKDLVDVSVFFAGEACFDGLSCSDREDVYMRYQEELTSRSEQEFQELLLERADLFFKFALPQSEGDTIGRSVTISPTFGLSLDESSMRELCENMQNHGHYRNFDYLPEFRQKMIFDHLIFFRSIAASPPALFPAPTDCNRPPSLCTAPNFDCPASPCVQYRLMEYLSGALSFRNNPSVLTRSLYVIGQAPWSTIVAAILRDPCCPFPNCRFNYEFHTPSNVIRPNVILHDTSRSRLPTIQENAWILLVYKDATSISQLEACASQLHHTSTADNFVVLHLCDVTFPSDEVNLLRYRGGQVAIQVNGYFAEMQLQPDTRFRQLSQVHSAVSNSTSVEVESLHLWNCLDNALHAAGSITPKLTIIIASMCGDLFHLDLVMRSVLTDSTRFAPWKQRLYIGDDREIILASYFQLLQLRTGTLPSHVHGLILLYWTARKASFAAMKAVTECCPLHWPKLFVGVGVNGREVCLQEGQHLAHDLDSSFIHIQPENTDHRARFDAFLRTCMSSKPITEQHNRPLLMTRRQMNHPSTLPPPPPPNSTARVVRRKSSAGTSGPRVAAGGFSSRKSWHSSNSGQDEGLIYSEPTGATPCGAQRSEIPNTELREKKKVSREPCSIACFGVSRHQPPPVCEGRVSPMLASPASHTLLRRGHKKLSRLRAKSSDNLRSLKQLVLGGVKSAASTPSPPAGGQARCASPSLPFQHQHQQQRWPPHKALHHKRSASAGGEGMEWYASTPPPRRPLSMSPLLVDSSSLLREDVNGTLRSTVEDEYSHLYDFPQGASPEHGLTNGASKVPQPTPLSTLNSNSQDMIYSDPLDINTYASQQKFGQTVSNQGGSDPKIIPTSRAPPFGVENVYAEVEGFNPEESQILHIVDPKRHSPSPPPPFPRTTSEVESHANLRFTRVSPPTPPEYDEPPRDLDSSSMLPSQRDRAPCGYQSHDEEAVTERVRHRSGGLISRHSSERRSHKESKKKTRSSERSGNAGASSSSSGANCASSGSHHSKWRIPFRSGYSSNSSTNATRASSATRNQSQSPRVQPPPPPQAPSYSHVTDAFVKSLTDFNERPGGLQTQGLYRECGNRTTAESIRQRSKDGYILDWLISHNVTPHDVATALKLFLRDLPEPVVPLSVQVWREISEHAKGSPFLAGEASQDARISRIRQALCTIPLLNQRLFYHLIYHFRKVTDFSNVNDMTASNLAICWTPTLLIPKTADINVLLTMKPIQDLLALVIEQADNIFQPAPC